MPKRRANGEGNIRKRKDGRWEGRYTAGHDPVTGKQIFKNVLGKTQAEVKNKLNTALEELKRIDVIVSDQMTTGEWLDTWLEHYAKPVMRTTTYNNYETLIRLHIKPYIGEVKPNKLTTYTTGFSQIAALTGMRQKTSPRDSAARRCEIFTR